MEPAKIDWKRIESVFVEDKVYENINAPKWVDFLAPEDEVPVDDEAWFCRPECKHPKTAEDFFKTTPSSKLPRSLERLPLGDRNQRLKRRGQSQSSFSSNDKNKFNEDSENQNPNSLTPQSQAKSMKGAVNSSSEKKKQIIDDTSQNDELIPRLKSTLSARNLFAGRDILNHITDFCNELKKLATRARERETVEKSNDKNSQVGVKKEVENESSCDVLGELDGREEKEKERKPLLEVQKQKSEGVEKGSAKDKQKRNKRFDEAENIPISLNVENIKHKGEERLLQIRTNPPSPQCFSATRPATKATPSKSSMYRSMERRILQELEQNKDGKKEEPADKGRSVSIVDGRETRALDVLWFLKPCTLSG